MKKVFLFIFLVLFSFQNIQAQEVKKELTTFDILSYKLYCFFTTCDKDIEVIQTNKVEKNEEGNNFIKKQNNNLIVNNNSQNKVRTNSSQKAKTEVVVKREVIDRTKYINQGKTVVKNYYNTIEKQPIINNTYPKEIIQKTERVIEEYDDSSLRKKISSNRRMISQLAGLTDDDNLSDNKLDDLGDVNVPNPADGQVLAWDSGAKKWIAKNSGSTTDDQGNTSFSGDVLITKDLNVSGESNLNDTQINGVLKDKDGDTGTENQILVADTDGKLNWVDQFITSVGDALTVVGQKISVLFDDTTIGINANNQLEIKDNGITTAKIADGVITKEKLDSEALTNTSIDKLADVDTTTNSPTNGQILSWDGENWVPISVSDLETTTTLTDVLNQGHLIGKYTNEDGQVMELKESVTELKDNGDQSFTFTDEAGNDTTLNIKDLETTTKIANKISGHKIADYTDEDGNITDINETITSLALNINSLDFTAEDGNTTNIDLSKYLDNTDQQQLSYDSDTQILSLDNGGEVDLSKLNENVYNTDGTLEENRTLDLNGNNFIFEGSGRIGIGTTNPSHKLQVVGNVKATRFHGADGTEGSPTFRFDSDTDTGMFKPDNNQLAFTTAGTERFRIDDNGRVGIGTQSPTDTLHIAGSLRLENELKDKNNEAGNQGEILMSTGDGVEWAPITEMNLGSIGLHSDVDLGSGPNDNQILRWNGSTWVPSNETKYTAGTGLTLNGTEFSVNLGDSIEASEITAGNDGQILVSNGGSVSWVDQFISSVNSAGASVVNGVLSILFDDTTIGVNGSNELEVKDNGINSAKIEDGSIGTADISNDAINSDKIATGAVKDDEIDYNAVTLADFTNDAGYLKSSDLNDDDATNELNTDFKLDGNKIQIVDVGGTKEVDLSQFMDNTDDQNIENLGLSGDTLTVGIENGNSQTVSLAQYALDTDLHDAVTLSGTRDYLTLNGQEISLNQIDISDDTNLTAGAGITLNGDSVVLNAGIDDLSDVDTSTNPPTDGQILVWDNANSKWVPSSNEGDNIYNIDGTLNSDRKIDLNSYDLSFGDNYIFVNGSNGKVGIGVSNPQAFLHVKTSGEQITTFDDGFEDGTIPPFTTSGDAEWVTDNTTAGPSGGSISAKNGDIDDNQSSSIEYTVNIASSGGTIKFDYKVSSESNYDYLKFYIDGSEEDSWSGEVAWTTSSEYNLSDGAHTVKWVYSKDGSVSNGDDTAWIDNVKITNVVTDSGTSAVFDGSVGIGTDGPSQLLQVGENGDGTSAIANAWNTFSDRRWKKNIKPLENSLDIVMKLQGVSYEWKTTGRSTIGFVAQDVRKILPYIVTEDKDGYLSIDYSKFSPVIVEALKEQQNEINLIKKSLGEDSDTVSFYDVIIKAFEDFGVYVKDNYISFQKAYFENVEIGSPEKPSGITMYDEDNGDAYCIKIKSGEFVKYKGTCEEVAKGKRMNNNKKNREVSVDDSDFESEGSGVEENQDEWVEQEEETQDVDSENNESEDQVVENGDDTGVEFSENSNSSQETESVEETEETSDTEESTNVENSENVKNDNTETNSENTESFEETSSDTEENIQDASNTEAESNSETTSEDSTSNEESTETEYSEETTSSQETESVEETEETSDSEENTNSEKSENVENNNSEDTEVVEENSEATESSEESSDEENSGTTENSNESTSEGATESTSENQNS